MVTLAMVRPEIGGDAELEAIARSDDLHALTQIIRNGKRTFLEVATALWRIREARLYKSTHESWESWCIDNWWGTKRSADRQIAAAKIAAEMSAAGQNVPRAASHLHALADVPERHRADVLSEATIAAGGEKITAAEIAAAARRPAPSIQNRRTPKWVFDALNARFGPFLLDAYAEPHNALCENFLTKEQDGNTSPWVNATFGNPEFKKGDNSGMALAVEQAVRQAGRGVRSCIIGPALCSQDWAHKFAIRGTIWLPDQRISYDTPEGEPTDGADRDSVVMTFGGEHANPDWRDGKFLVRRLELGAATHRATGDDAPESRRVQSPGEANVEG